MLLNKSLIDLVHYQEDFPFLWNRLGLLGIGVEVGVQRGDFSKHILKYWNGKKLYMVDTWRHLQGYFDMANGDHNVQLDNMAKSFMAVYEYDVRAAMIRDYSLEAAKLFPDESLDWVFIDGDHSYEAVVADLQIWSPKIRPNGILCGHDYVTCRYEKDAVFAIGFPPEEANSVAEFGVQKAVDEWSKLNSLTLHVAMPPSDAMTLPSWFIQIPSETPSE